MTQLVQINFIKQLSKRLLSVQITSQNVKQQSLQCSQKASLDPDSPKFDMENPFEKEKQQCILCKHNIIPDYKNVKLLSQFQSSYTGRIYGRHITGLCKTKQEIVELEIKKAQTAGLMGYYTKEPCFLKDPKLFDPEHPIRPHRF